MLMLELVVESQESTRTPVDMYSTCTMMDDRQIMDGRGDARRVMWSERESTDMVRTRHL